MAIVAKGDNIVIRNVTDLPEPNSQHKSLSRGTVVAVGPGVSDILANDVLFFRRNYANCSEVNGNTYYTIDATEAVATNNP